jgi:hypothetical protein
MVIAGPGILHGALGSALITASLTRHFAGIGVIAAGRGSGDSALNWPPLAVSVVAAAIALVAVTYSVKSTHVAQDSANSGKRLDCCIAAINDDCLCSEIARYV